MLDTYVEEKEEKSIQQISALAELLAKKRVKKVCIEAGHIYMDEIPNGQHHLSLKLGGMFAEILGRTIPSIVKMLFIDDYNPSVSTLQLPEYLELAESLGFSPDVTVWESSLVSDARKFVGKLNEAGATVINPEGHTHTRHQNIRLRYVDDRLTCCSLDAALYARRFREYDFNLTILPGESECEYRKQQRNVRRLLRLAGIENLPLANVFFYQDGNFSISKPE